MGWRKKGPSRIEVAVGEFAERFRALDPALQAAVLEALGRAVIALEVVKRLPSEVASAAGRVGKETLGSYMLGGKSSLGVLRDAIKAQLPDLWDILEPVIRG